MGRFADLLPDSSDRQYFWMEQIGLVKSLLMDVNEDLLHNRGELYSDLTGEHGPFPHLTLPNICLSYNDPEQTIYSIGICVAPQGGALRLRAAIRESAIFWRDIHYTAQLETALRSALVWMMDEGVINTWIRK